MLYYELLERVRSNMTPTSVEPGYYAKDEYLADHDMPPGLVSYAANRIWREQNGKVDYVKFKGGQPQKEIVDMAEFTWIKLKAEVIE